MIGSDITRAARRKALSGSLMRNGSRRPPKAPAVTCNAIAHRSPTALRSGRIPAMPSSRQYGSTSHTPSLRSPGSIRSRCGDAPLSPLTGMLISTAAPGDKLGTVEPHRADGMAGCQDQLSEVRPAGHLEPGRRLRACQVADGVRRVPRPAVANRHRTFTGLERGHQRAKTDTPDVAPGEGVRRDVRADRQDGVGVVTGKPERARQVAAQREGEACGEGQGLRGRLTRPLHGRVDTGCRQMERSSLEPQQGLRTASGADDGKTLGVPVDVPAPGLDEVGRDRSVEPCPVEVLQSGPVPNGGRNQRAELARQREHDPQAAKQPGLREQIADIDGGLANGIQVDRRSELRPMPGMGDG